MATRLGDWRCRAKGIHPDAALYGTVETVRRLSARRKRRRWASHHHPSNMCTPAHRIEVASIVAAPRPLAVSADDAGIHDVPAERHGGDSTVSLADLSHVRRANRRQLGIGKDGEIRSRVLHVMLMLISGCHLQVVIGAMDILSNTFCIFAVRCLGKRKLFLASILGCSICCYILSKSK